MKIAILVVVLAAATLCMCEASKLTVHRVSVRNNVLPKAVMTVHCKSRDDDLGVQTLQPNQAWGFKFRPGFFTPSLFTCQFHWAENDYNVFIIWDGRHTDDPAYKCNTCIWTIRESGPCRFNGDKHKYVCFPWIKF